MIASGPPWSACSSLPANRTQIAAAEADTTGTTTLGKRVIDHSFQLPLQVCWIVTALAGVVIVWLFFGGHARAASADDSRSVTVRGAAFLGIGAMVGAGIFALLGEAGSVAGSAVWLSFLLAGVVRAPRLHGRQARCALPVLGRADRLPDRGLRERSPRRHRLVARLLRCDRDRLLDGRGLLRQLRDVALRGDDAAGWWDNVFTTAVVIGMAGINIVGSRVVDRAQSLIVIVLLGVFAVFIAATLVDIDLDLLAFSGYPSPSQIVASVAPTFFAYLGFSVITFAAGDLRDPARELPSAMYAALAEMTVLYPDRARRLRDAHGRRGDRVRRDRDRGAAPRSGTADS